MDKSAPVCVVKPGHPEYGPRRKILSHDLSGPEQVELLDGLESRYGNPEVMQVLAGTSGGIAPDWLVDLHWLIGFAQKQRMELIGLRNRNAALSDDAVFDRRAAMQR